MAAALAPYHVEAFNTAKVSENKIHDDAVAKQFGFGGGLVPGVDVYAYMSHQPIEHWGRAWLEHGTAECRFSKPVYDGDNVTVSATEEAGILDIKLECRGVLCATGSAALPAAVAPPPLAEFERVPERGSRPTADDISLPVGAWLGMVPVEATPELAREYLDNVRETSPLYAKEGLIHPVVVLRMCNFVLTRNVTFGPWMHVGSKIQHFAAARVGDSLGVRARVIGNYEHKGHLFVDIDALVLADESRPVARVTHVSIYRPRQLTAA
jgi:acyl dehydratase